MLTALMLVGCEPIDNLLPQLPGSDPPMTESPTAGVSVQSPAITQMEAEVQQR